jgi:hypothetical protein
MAKRHKPEEIIAKLRQVEVMTGQGTSMADAIPRTPRTPGPVGAACRCGWLPQPKATRRRRMTS